jgi:hypothetical protein
MRGWHRESVEHWTQSNGSDNPLSYVFIAYTSEQFYTDDDYQALHGLAERAARDAKVDAYWVGCTCMPEAQHLQEDVIPRSPK